MKKKIRFREAMKNIGVKSLIPLILVFLLAIAATVAGAVRLYQSTKENIDLQGHVNAVRSAKEYDKYLLIRKNTVILASEVVNEMIRRGQSNDVILEYMTAESLSIKKSIDKDYTGLYGWINNDYLDGDGWVPDADYVPTERPWYIETMQDDSDITFVQPYLDEQTKTVLTTMACRLDDGKSVIAMDVTLGRIEEITQEITADSEGSYGIVLDKIGQVIAHTDAAELGKNYLEEKDTLGAALAEKLYSTEKRMFELRYQGQRYSVFVEPIEGGWQALSLINTRVFYRPLLIILVLLAIFTILEVIVFVLISRNLVERNLAISSAEAANSANRAKSQFLSRMSHEIRTPINAIIGLDNIALRDENIPEHTRETLDKIGSSAHHLLSIVNDILDMSRIESGRTELNEEVFAFSGLLDEIRVIVGGQCDDRGLTFTLDEEEGLQDYYFGDALKLKQVIINILGNSVKFTDPPGEITFRIRQLKEEGERAFLQFAMQDTGIGMDPEYLPKLFDAFTQEDAGNTSRFGGSGLGLAITKSLVDMMGGEIAVESKKGVGTTFLVTVPLGIVKEEDIPKNTPEETEEGISFEGLHLLIVEDQELNAEVLTDLLELEGITSEWAENGQKGMEQFEGSEEGHFDAILMDIRMPVLDGLAATREIRKLERPDAKTIPIIALSANAFEEDVKECLDAGMNRHLSKPVDIDALKAVLRDLIAEK